MTNMLAAYIATVSAFSAVNMTFLPPVVRWLWPTVIGTIAITAWSTSYRVRLKVTGHGIPGAPESLSRGR